MNQNKSITRAVNHGLAAFLACLVLVSCKQRKEIGALQLPVEAHIQKDADNPEIEFNRFSTGQHYLQIDQIETTPNSSELEFSISWDGSWRSGNTYDAAWIFIKGRDDKDQWHHVRLKHAFQKVSDGQETAETHVSPEGIGLMVFRNRDGAGRNSWRLSVELLNGSSFEEFRVFGLEMVHVAGGAFELGTLKSIRARREVLTPGAGGAPYDPFFTYSISERDNYGGIYKVSSETSISIGPEEGNLFWIDADIPGTNTFSGVPEGELGTSYPKGYQAFYQMKYELSQQEYCDFLNTLNPKQQVARDITGTREFDKNIAEYRNAISRMEGIYVTNRPHRPCNFISWLDGQAFADWAGLRHMTELEFEKACRGPEPAVYREYVWGVNEIDESRNMQYCTTFFEGNQPAREEVGNETIDGNIHASMFSYRNFIDVCTRQGNFYDPSSTGCRSFTGGDGGRGPVRKGIFGSTSQGNRILAGATYFGAMEMGGNLQEPVVTVGHPSGRKFEGSHGDGNLDAQGNATNDDWQPIDGEYAFAGRGGCWKFHENHARTADRFKGLRKRENRRASHIGFRGVRTAW